MYISYDHSLPLLVCHVTKLLNELEVCFEFGSNWEAIYGARPMIRNGRYSVRFNYSAKDAVTIAVMCLDDSSFMSRTIATLPEEYRLSNTNAELLVDLIINAIALDGL